LVNYEILLSLFEFLHQEYSIFAIENRKPNTLSLNEYHQQTGQKAMSADSILAMFRNFNTAMAMTEISNYLSASTTPSCSSLQDEVVGSEDESLMSNTAHSPGGGKESPTRYRYSNVIQVSQQATPLYIFRHLVYLIFLTKIKIISVINLLIKL